MTLLSTVRAYPYERWPGVQKQQQRWLTRVLRALPRSFDSALTEADGLLGVLPRLEPGRAELLSAESARAELRPGGVIVHLERILGARAWPLLCELPAELAATLVDRVLGGDGCIAHPVGHPLDDLSLGILGYLAARACAAAGSHLQVRAVTTAQSAASALTAAQSAASALGDSQVLVWPIALELDHRAAHGWLRVFLGEQTAGELAAAGPAAPGPLCDPLRGLELQLCAHAAAAVLSRNQLAALAPGDVIVPERSSLSRTDDGFCGAVELHPIGSRRSLGRCIARPRELVLETLFKPERVPMTDTKRIDPQPPASELSALAGDAPVELCLELARFTLRLDELSALRPGEVLSTRRAIGEHATLSAAGKALAYGELVDIDGEVGLRIRELARS